MNQNDRIRPRVSVVIPAYNAEHTIHAAVASALSQSMSEVEVVVCDDASKDRTLEVLRSIPDPRLVILHNDSNLGPGGARDRAISAACGKWIAVLDADDVWHEHRLQVLLDAVGNEPDVMVFDDLLICHHTPSGLSPWRRMRGTKAFGGGTTQPTDVTVAQWARSYQFLIKPLIHAEALRRSGVRHSGLKFGEDTEFFLRLSASGVRLRYVPVAYYHYRITPNSASANSQRDELMSTVLRSAIPLFVQQPDAQDALLYRIDYRSVLRHLKSAEFVCAARTIINRPSLLKELIHRTCRQLLYLGHRRLHSGAAR